MASSQFSSTNKLELLRKRCWITASSWWLFAMFQSRARRRLDLFFHFFLFLFWLLLLRLFLSLLLDSVVFLAVLQCSAIWVGGTQSSASWANVHITKTTLQSCTLETRSSAKLKSVQKTVIIRKKPLHFGLGFGLCTLLLLFFSAGLSKRGQGLKSHENLDLPLKFLEPMLRSKTSWRAVEGKFLLLQALCFLFSGQIEVFSTFHQHWIY